MTLITLDAERVWPGHTLGMTASPAHANGVTIDSAGDQQAFIFTAPRDMAIDRVGFRPASVTSSPTALYRIESVANGAAAASGTLFDTSNGGSTATSGVLSTTSMNVAVLAQPATISKGTRLAVVIKWNGVGSFITSSFSRGGLNEGSLAYPFQSVNTTGSNVASVMTSHAVIVGSSASNFYRLPGFLPVPALGNVAVANNAAARAACLRFKVFHSCRIIGMRASLSNLSLTDDFTISLQTGVTTGAVDVGSTSKSFDADEFPAAGVPVDLPFASAFTPVLDTWYRAVIQSDTTSGFNPNYFTLENANHAKAIPFGVQTQHGERNSSGDWTDYDTRIPLIDLVIDQLDDGASVGGGASFSPIGVY
jgi:hypothetical protein